LAQHALRVVDVDGRTSGKPNSDMVSWRWISVITVAPRACEIELSAARRRTSSSWR
jgi:hypothetical protein